MEKPWKMAGRILGDDITTALLLVFPQIDAYKRAETRKFQLQLAALGEPDGEQAAQGPAAQAGATLSQRQPETEK